jgi:hypothetical protein
MNDDEAREFLALLVHQDAPPPLPGDRLTLYHALAYHHRLNPLQYGSILLQVQEAAVLMRQRSDNPFARYLFDVARLQRDARAHRFPCELVYADPMASTVQWADFERHMVSCPPLDESALTRLLECLAPTRTAGDAYLEHLGNQSKRMRATTLAAELWRDPEHGGCRVPGNALTNAEVKAFLMGLGWGLSDREANAITLIVRPDWAPDGKPKKRLRAEPK